MHRNQSRTLTITGALILALALLLPISSWAQAPDDGLSQEQQKTQAPTTSALASESRADEPQLQAPDTDVEQGEAAPNLFLPARFGTSPTWLTTNTLPRCGTLHNKRCKPAGAKCTCSDGIALGSCFCTTESTLNDGILRWECAF